MMIMIIPSFQGRRLKSDYFRIEIKISLFNCISLNKLKSDYFRIEMKWDGYLRESKR